MDHARLLEGLKGREPQAFNALYGAYRPRLFSFLLRLSGRSDLAGDLSQEVWLKVAVHVPTLRHGSDLKAWLFTLARNAFLSHQRSLRWQAQKLLGLGSASSEATSSAPTPLERVEAGEAVERAERGLKALPLKYREVLLLAGVEQLDAREVGMVLDLTPEAVRQRLSRARSMLARAMESL
jgi:RNA polymerase sigma-70 factor (ECF subfamily)